MRFQVHLDRDEVSPDQTGPHADWARLCTHQCASCPLRGATHPYCPAAVDLEQIVEQFRGVLSYESVRIEVDTPQRSYSKTCDAQTGLRSLMGLVMATGRCPWFRQLRALADTHLPFASIEETLQRVAGSYLLQQYFVAVAGGEPDFEMVRLSELYSALWDVNQSFKRRLEVACMSDANLNAIGALSSISQGISISLQEQLQGMKAAFATHPIALPEEFKAFSSARPDRTQPAPSTDQVLRAP